MPPKPKALTAARRGCRRRLGGRKRGLGSKNLRECRIGAHLVHVAAAHADRTNQLIFHDDRQTTSDEVISEAGGLTEV